MDPPRPETSKSKLLAAVVDRALDGGVSQQSLRAIAAAAGTNHRMLLFHFKSRENLLVEVTREVEARQRRVFEDSLAEVGGTLEEAGSRLWERLSDPSLHPQERLFFELYGQALQGRSWAEPLLAGVVENWARPIREALLARGVDPDRARDEARLAVALARGLLLDLLATGDRAGVDAAMRRYRALSALDPAGPEVSGSGAVS